MKKHNPISTFFGVAACKATRSALRVMHRGGTTLPGRSAMLFDKSILETVSKNMFIIVVTGTNGKTTTCSMIRNAMQENGVEPLSNISGANLLTGITAEFTANASLTGRPKKKYAIVECDEGALKKVVPLIKPKIIVVTNLFRDQLDRYGEVMHTLEEIRKGAELVPDTVLALNADCSLTSSLAEGHEKVYYYGISAGEKESNEALSDAKYCIKCGTEYEYDFHTYAHLGGFRCPKCGYSRHNPDMNVVSIDKLSSSGTDVTLNISGKEKKVHIGLPALYNVYNALAAMSAFAGAGKSPAPVLNSISKVSSSFGRMEEFTYNNVKIQMILVKNPAGCNQSLSYLSSLDEDYVAVFCLNDKTADGHDISWIYDADHEKVTHDPHCKKLYVFGTRAEDMKVRLKYADAPEDSIEVIHDEKKLIEAATSHGLPVFMLPNYTSMLSVRATLSSMTGKKDFWEDQKNG